jgi:hypothetical protein
MIMGKQADDCYNDKETQSRFEAALKSAMNTPRRKNIKGTGAGPI